MAATEPTAHPSIGEIIAFNDEELDRYLQGNRLSNDGYVVIDIEGLEDLPKDQQDHLIQRLR
jgi:hypothetical protein